MKTCFIICPIGEEGSETRKRSDSLLKHIISPVCAECDFQPVRIDQENISGQITDGIYKHLQEDDLVIADLTDGNPNAFYEIGYRTALNKPSIHLIKKDSHIPFDVSTIRCFSYDLTDLDSVAEIKERLIQTIKSFNFSLQSSEYAVPSNNQNMVNTQILQEIYKLQDSIANLSKSITNTDTSAISVLADKLANINSKPPEMALAETFLLKIIEQPEMLIKISEIAEQLPSKK